MVRERISKKEFIERFTGQEGKGVLANTDPLLLISQDRVLGVPRDFKEECYISLGKYKLRTPRLPNFTVVETLGGLSFHIPNLYRALFVFRRRKIFELGLYQLYHGRVFAIKDGGNVILMAPYISEERVVPFKSLVTHVNEKLFKDIKEWLKILEGTKNET